MRSSLYTTRKPCFFIVAPSQSLSVTCSGLSVLLLTLISHRAQTPFLSFRVRYSSTALRFGKRYSCFLCVTLSMLHIYLFFSLEAFLSTAFFSRPLSTYLCLASWSSFFHVTTRFSIFLYVLLSRAFSRKLYQALRTLFRYSCFVSLLWNAMCMIYFLLSMGYIFSSFFKSADPPYRHPLIESLTLFKSIRQYLIGIVERV